MEAWKIQGFDWIWTRELAIQVRRSNQLSYEAASFRDCNQLSYEATDVGTWSFDEPVRNEWGKTFIN